MVYRKKRLEEIYKSMRVELIQKDVENFVISDNKKYVQYAPNYQRNYIWTEVKATNLIETVLMHGIVPPLTVIKKDKQIVIIDGRQRYETLLRFYNNEFELKQNGLQKLKDWSDKSYDGLAPNLKTLFREYKIKMICYTIEDSINISDEDLERVGRDLFRRHNFGTTALRRNEIARAKYCYDILTSKFETLFKTENELYNQCVEIFLPESKRKADEREKINFLLIAVRELITALYIPMIGEKYVSFSAKVIDSYYDKFIRKLADKEQLDKIKEFKKIFEKLCLIKEKLKEVNHKLQDNVGFFKSVYWMFSILYYIFPNKFYDFNVDQFCHYVEDDTSNYFDTYNQPSGYDTEKRNSYMKSYMEKELKIDINIYLDKIKENKKAVLYKKDSTINQDRDWNSIFLSQRVRTRNETMGISEIIKKIGQGRLIVRSNYQRGEVQDRTKASRVIESIILGVKLPPIYLYADDIPGNGLGKYTVLDGQQRLINILEYMGEKVTNENYNAVETYKNRYALRDLTELEDLNGKVFKEGPNGIDKSERDLIKDYIFDVIMIDKQGNENIDVIDIFIRLNQNPCPISISSFEMWNSFDITNTINRIKEIAQYRGFKQYRNTMQEEELVTILAYMHYKKFRIQNIDQFFKINLRTDNKDTKKEKTLIKISVREKRAITTFLEKMKPNDELEEEFLKSVDAVNDFVDKLKILSNNDEKLLIKVLNPYKAKAIKGDKNCFYIMWLILQELDIHIINTYKKEIWEDLENMFKLMQNIPKGKNEEEFIKYVKSIITKYCK